MIESGNTQAKNHHSKASQHSKKSTTKIFNNELENIDYKKLKALIIKINNCFPSDNLDELDIIAEESEISSTLFVNQDKNRFSKARESHKTYNYPKYKKGSFEKDIQKFLNTYIIINELFTKIEEEINKIYKGYILTENIIYEKMNTIMNFYGSRETYNDLQIVSRIKEISEILKETKKLIINYIYHNFDLLTKLLSLMDNQLSKLYQVENMSLYFLLNIFDLPNNELTYILMFKIIDEECILLKYIAMQLENKIKYPKEFMNEDLSRGISISEINTFKEDEKDMNNSLLPKDEEENSSELEDKKIALLNLMETYTNKVYKYIDDISNCNKYRAKHKNYFIYLKGNFNLNFFDDLSYEDENDISKTSSKTEDFLPINSLMDEEVIIKKFLNESTVEHFLNYFKKNLSFNYKMDEFLIILHSFQIVGFTIPIFFWYNDSDSENEKDNITYNCLYIIFFYLGKFCSKIIGQFLLKKFFKLKSLIIISNIIMITSFLISFINFNIGYNNVVLMCSRFLLGLSYFPMVEIRFLLKYVPKLLLVKTIKKHYRLKYLYICFCLLFTTLVNKFYSKLLIMNKIYFFNNIFYKENIENNKNEFIFLLFSVITLFINLICFKNLKYSDIIKYNKIDNEENTESFKKTASDKTEEKRSVISYGKCKVISKKNMQEVKLIDEKFRESVKNNIYEGNNYIFYLLAKLIKNENKSNCSKTNRTSLGFLFLLLCTMINHLIIIFSVPLIIDNKQPKNNLWIYSISYLSSFIIYYFKAKLFRGITNKISRLNIIFITIIISQIIFNVIFFLIIKLNPNNFEKNALALSAIVIIIFNNLMEIFTLQLMNQTIPIEKLVCGIIITNFIDISEIILKGILMLIISIFYNYLETQMIIIIILSYIGMILSILGGFFYIIINFKLTSSALVRIMNKISYESLE